MSEPGKKTQDYINNEVVPLVNKVFGDMMYERAPKWRQFPEGLRWQYFGELKLFTGVWACCWSTTRNVNGKFVSWVYMPNVGKGTWEFKKQLEHRKMKDAKARALRLYGEHKPIQEKYLALFKARERKKRR